MKYYLLGVSKCAKLNKSINIGDYIQALASSQFYPKLDGFLDRDEDLRNYEGDECKMIMNGWYMHNPINWPPSRKIAPLFVAFHLNPLAQSELTSQESISYLKGHQPIGCRDKHTALLLQSLGVDAYFSGCMTLTLGLKYHKKTSDGSLYFVDPRVYMSISKFQKFYTVVSSWLKHPRICAVIFNNKNAFRDISIKRRILIVAKFIHDYSKLFSIRDLKNAHYTSHQSTYYYTHFKSDEERLKEAKRLVEAYSRASLVVTSRIHCALPCLGIGTPVIYTALEGDSFVSTSRMNGLIELFNVIKCSKYGLKPLFDCKLPITTDNPLSNKTNWKALAKALMESCRKFIIE